MADEDGKSGDEMACPFGDMTLPIKPLGWHDAVLHWYCRTSRVAIHPDRSVL